jgi:diguanylate cyclase (GGDEF)-like protein/PAS domain S-box-containing protein
MSLRYRIAATIFALEIVLIAAILWVTLGHSMRSVGQQLAGSQQVTLQLVGDLSKATLLSGELGKLQAFIEGTGHDPNIHAVTVADRTGQVVAATDRALIGGPWPGAPEGQRTYYREVKIDGTAGRVGQLAIEFSRAPLWAAFRNTLQLGITVAIIGLLVIALVGLAIGHVLTRRLTLLASAADQVAAGDTSVRVALPGQDEVARVGRAFNSMVNRIASNLEALEAARDRLMKPTEAMSEGVALWNRRDRLVFCNAKFRDICRDVEAWIRPGMAFSELTPLLYDHLLAHDGMAPDRDVWIRDSVSRHRAAQGARELHLRNGRWLSICEFRTADGELVSIYTDITEMKNRQRALHLGKQRLRAIMNAVIDGIVTVTADGRIETCNAAACRIFGYPESELLGRPFASLLVGSGESFDPYLAVPALAGVRQEDLLEMTGIRQNGDTFPVELSLSTIALHGEPTLIVTVRDITARKATERLILHNATHDALTNLPNRVLFDERLRAAVEQAEASGEVFAVLFFDLDRFKMVNDSLGHSVGDALLIAVGQRLSAAVGVRDIVARMGGDEFILILRHLRRGEDLIRPAQAILEAIRPPFHVHGHELHITASIGISLYPDDEQCPEQLLKLADVALYRAKAAGRNRAQLVKPTMNASIIQQMMLEGQLRRAIEQDQLALVFQPQVNLASGKVVGVEALVRWQHPEMGLVPPEQFVPLAEETGLIEPLGLWVLKTACAQHRRWREAGVADLRLAVNVSARQLQRGRLDKKVFQACRESGMDPKLLELELTESVLMQEGESSLVLERLTASGISLALDDFGTGYASLSYLRRFPIDRLKIDRSFVRDLDSAAGDGALACAVIHMAHALGLDVIAEGVETLEQIQVLRRFRCDEVQGFLIGKPMLGEQILSLVKQRSRAWPVHLAAVEAT